jgi:type II secretory pathway predicted ATPase ExeA
VGPNQLDKTSLDRTKYTLIYLANPSGGCRGLYVAIATALGATPRFHKAEAINQVASLLAAEEHERHRRVVLAIDEAHLLSPEQLEEIRLLSNAELDSASPFAGVLLGQPTLAARLRQGVFAALDQRISVRYSLGGMDLAESVAYLRHHLALAGFSKLKDPRPSAGNWGHVLSVAGTIPELEAPQRRGR